VLGALLGALHLLSLPIAWWVGRPWELGQPLALGEREVLEGMAVATVPAQLQVVEAPWATTLGRPSHDPLVVWFGVVQEEGLTSKFFQDLEGMGAVASREIPCGPRCYAERLELPPDRILYGSVQSFGIVGLTTTVLLQEAPEDHQTWAEAHIGKLRLTDQGSQVLVSLALQRRAQAQFEQELQILEAMLEARPTDRFLRNHLAWLLATNVEDRSRDGARAVGLAEALVAEFPGDWRFVDTLAAAYAEIGDFERAVATQERAVSLAARDSEEARRETQTHLATLRAGKPVRQL
jgi:hypothetical protein